MKSWLGTSSDFFHEIRWEACISVLPRLLPHLQWWLQRSNLLTGVLLNPSDSTLTLYTDTSLTGWGCLHRWENSVRGVRRLSFRRHIWVTGCQNSLRYHWIGHICRWPRGITSIREIRKPISCKNWRAGTDDFLFGRFPVEKYVPISSERSYPFCDRVAPQTGFPNFMEKVGASTQPRLDSNKSQELAELGGNRNMEIGVCQMERRCPHT
jgi:hypothetical protein